jgi:hypothetical protein
MSKIKPLLLETSRKPTDLTHGLFRFPGRFHPPLVAYLLEQHPDAKIIGDPMVGSGTVAVEASALGKDGIYSDIDPLSCLLTRAKSTPVDAIWLNKAIESIIVDAQPFAKSGISIEEAVRYVNDLESNTDFRSPPNVFHWFEPYIVVNLCKTLQALSRIDCSSEQKDALLAVFAGVIRRISRADPNTSSGLEVTKVRLLALEKGLSFDIANELRKKAKLLSNGYNELSKISMVKPEIIQYDAKNWSSLCNARNKWPDLIITSPCYISAIEYWRRHKLEYCWLGLVHPEKLADMKGKFLGMGNDEPIVKELPPYVQTTYDKLRKIGRQKDAKTLVRYFADSIKWLNEVRLTLCKTNGTAYVVVGSNTNHGVTLDTPFALQEIAKSVGLSTTCFMKYAIKNSYMQYPTNGKRIKTESVLKIW